MSIIDTVHCGNCGYDFSTCVCGEWTPSYGQQIYQSGEQPSKVQEKEILEQLAAKEKEIEEFKKENELLEAREVAWQNKHSFLNEEIQRLKGLINSKDTILLDVERIFNLPKCYKTNGICRFECKGLCRESC